jgi:hypothetical protein
MVRDVRMRNLLRAWRTVRTAVGGTLSMFESCRQPPAAKACPAESRLDAVATVPLMQVPEQALLCLRLRRRRRCLATVRVCVCVLKFSRPHCMSCAQARISRARSRLLALLSCRRRTTSRVCCCAPFCAGRCRLAQQRYVCARAVFIPRAHSLTFAGVVGVPQHRNDVVQTTGV